MIKKILSLLLAALMVISMAACGSEPSNTESVPPEAPSKQTEAPAPVETQAPVIFEETVIVDDENCTFTITAIEYDSIWGYTLKAYLENKTDKDLTFSFNDVSVNGFMCDPLWAATVTTGMKANESIYFYKDSFERNGIKEVTEIVFTLDVYDSNDWMADHLVSDVFSIYPMGEDAVQTYEWEPQDGDIVLFDNENCTMIITGFDPDNMWGYSMNVHLVNKTDKTLMFSINDAAVNGFMCDPFWAESVTAGHRSNTSITWFTSSLEEAGVTDVESLTFTVRIYDNDDWLAADLLNETFTVEP